MTEPPMPPDLDPATHRAIAVGLYDQCWRLLDLPERTPAQDDELLHAAHASRWHWGEVADVQARLWRGEWLCSRVYATLGRAEPARWHADRALGLFRADAGGAEDWDEAAILEAIARSAHAAGDEAGCAAWKARAAAAAVLISEDDDRAVIERDLASLPG